MIEEWYLHFVLKDQANNSAVSKTQFLSAVCPDAYQANRTFFPLLISFDLICS